MPLPFCLTDRVVFSAGGAMLDRASHLRAEAGRLLDDGGLVLPVCEGRVLIDLGDGGPRLGWRGAGDARLDAAAGPAPFLGMLEARARFCADLSALGEDAAREAYVPAKFIDLRSIGAELSARRRRRRRQGSAGTRRIPAAPAAAPARASRTQAGAAAARPAARSTSRARTPS